MSSSNGKLRKATQPQPQARSRLPSIHWLFRSNIPRRRASYISPEVHKRNFFGMGEILGVITKPAETVRSLTESKKLLEEARNEMREKKERSQIRTKHTFSRLPGFFPRKAEMRTIERAMEGEPSFTVLFGASSVGKTALLREVLCREEYHVLHFDLRIAGFADLASLYNSLSQQMEQYFEEIANKMEGYEDFEREAWSFKHDRLNVERRLSDHHSNDGRAQGVKTSDVARLMELFQSSLLRYWEFTPATSSDNSDDEEAAANEQSKSTSKKSQSEHVRGGGQASSDTQRTHVDHANQEESSGTRSKWNFMTWGKSKANRRAAASDNARKTSQVVVEEETPLPVEGENEKGKEKLPVKKMPVIFFDEAHKLPALIQSTETMKCLLDCMLVLTKQDRLCHVIHATSDPFYQTWLRQFNVMQHCKIITIGDCSKAETRKFFRERLIPRVPSERLRRGLNFEHLYEAFGGKFAHWHDYITDYVNSNGALDIKQSSHFLQAHALLNLHIIHSSQAPTAAAGLGGGGPQVEGESAPGAANASNAETLHPGLGPAGFKIYSPLTRPYIPGSMTSIGGEGVGGSGGAGDSQFSSGMITGPPEFSAMELLKVMSRLARPETQYLPYFHLCRELGVRAVDGMVKGRVLDLRWTETVTKESGEEPRVVVGRGQSGNIGNGFIPGAPGNINTNAPGVGLGPPPPPIDEDEAMEPVSEVEPQQQHGGDVFEAVMEVVGPKLVPTTPIMRYAMRDVVQEYEDDQSMSEYASLSDVDEY